MRAAQFLILTKLLNDIPIPDYIHAFERGRSIPSMAEQHVGQGLVISLDLKDFFTSIKQKHLQGIFEHLGISSVPARTLSELCTYDSFVPQGAITSPKISNIVSSLTFGPLVKAYCDSRGYNVSIYADDITISTPEDLIRSSGYEPVTQIIQDISSLVRQYGFRINREKTKTMRPFQRQYVCGVVVNQRVNLQQHERRRLRAMVHNCERNGTEQEAQKSGLTRDAFISQLQGKLNWFSQLNEEKGSPLKERFLDLVKQEGYCEMTLGPVLGELPGEVALELPEEVAMELPEASPPVQQAQPAEVPWVV